MKREKGFTLIELLAVIIIIALISLIAIPFIVNTIETSRRQAFKNSVMVGARELDKYTVNHSFNFTEGEEVTVSELKEVLKHNFINGKYIIKNGMVQSDLITDGRYCAKGPMSDLKINRDCYKLDDTDVIIDMDYLELKSNPTEVSVTLKKEFAKDPESGIKEYRISLYNGSNKIETKSAENIGNSKKFTFSDLIENKTYSIVITVENNNDMVKAVELSLNKPSYVVNPSGWSQSKTIAITYPSGYTNKYSLDLGDTWEEYEETITLTENKSVIARITSGDNYIEGSVENITTIDRSAPTVASVVEVSKTSKSITVRAIGTDNESGIYGFQFKLDNGSWSDIVLADQDGVSVEKKTYNNLTKGTHNITVRAINKTYNNEGINELNTTESTAKAISTEQPTVPSYSINPYGWAQSKTVTINFNDEEGKYTHSYQKDNGEWTVVNGNTVDVTFNDNGYLLAKLNDGTNDFEGYINGSSYSVSGIDNSHPTDVEFTYIKTSNSITVSASANDSESDIYGYLFSKDNGVTWVSTNGTNIPQSSSSYTFSGLKNETDYQIKVKAINNTFTNVGGINNNNSYDSSNEEIKTNIINAPSYSIDKTGWQTSKTVTINFNDSEGKYSHYYQKDNGEWTVVDGNTVDVTFTANGSVLAKVTDGTNDVTGYETGSSYSVSEIDTTAPSVSASIGTRTTNSVVVNATCSDESDITLIEYSSNNGSSYVSDSTNTSHTFTGLSQGTSYNFKVRCTNGAALRNESSTASATTKATAAFNGNGGSNGTSKTLDVGAQLGDLPSSSRSYIITYNTNSQSATSSKSNETVSYTFNGWYTATSGGSQISTTTTMPSGGTTYYAQWTSKSTTLATITRTGYTCTWNTKSDGTGTSYASGKTGYTPSSTHTLYARCSINQYTATFNGNGGSNGTSITKNYNAALGTLPSSTRANYVFAGWYTAASGGSQISSSTTMPAGGATYYAHWTAAKAYSSQTKAYYTTVQAAITATSSGEVKVLANSSENLSIASGKSITLNLNGKTVTGNVSTAGTVTMNGSGQITGIVTNTGNFTLTNGTIYSNKTSRAFQHNGGTLTMNGGKIQYTLSDGGTALYNDGKTVNINGGSIVSNSHGLVTHGGTSTVKNASISGKVAVYTRNNGTTKLTSCTISGTDASLYNDVDSINNMQAWYCTINSGRVAGKAVRFVEFSAGDVEWEVFGYNSTNIQCPTWSESNGQDDIQWYDAGSYTLSTVGTYKYCRIYKSNHKNNTGTYNTHFYVKGGSYFGGFQFTMK